MENEKQIIVNVKVVCTCSSGCVCRSGRAGYNTMINSYNRHKPLDPVAAQSLLKEQIRECCKKF